MKPLSVLCILVMLLAPTIGFAHPHFNKTVSAKLPSGAEATIAYNTTPSNMTHAADAPTGTFVTPRRPSLSLSADAMSGSTAIPAGDYTIGVVKNGSDDWTMALHPKMARGDQADMSKVIKLDSMYSSSDGTAEHMLIDITPGHGKFEGKAVLTLHFGTMFLAGTLS